MENLKLLKKLEKAGCQLTVNVPVFNGNQTIAASPEQVLRLLQDKQEVYGELLGLNRTDYIEWIASQGSVYCSAKTQKGTRCRNTITSACFLPPLTWRSIYTTGGYCSVHSALTNK